MFLFVYTVYKNNHYTEHFYICQNMMYKVFMQKVAMVV